MNLSLSYVLKCCGIMEPVSVTAAGLYPDKTIQDISDEVISSYDLRPREIINRLGLLKLDYSKLSGGNHMVYFS